MINTILELKKRKLEISAFLKQKSIKIFDKYLTEIYLNGKEEDIFDYFRTQMTDKQYIKIEFLIKEFERVCLIVEHTRVIKNLDHRLIYLFLKYHYGNNKLNKILWNIEMKSINSHEIETDDIKEQLEKINFDKSLISKMVFTKDSSTTTFKIGKIL